MRRRIWHAAQVVAGLTIVAFVADYVRRNWAEVQRAQIDWRLDPLLLLFGAGVVWIVFALLADAWRRMVAAWGRPLRWWDGATIWLLSSMAKYVPGKVWSLTGMAVLAERRGVSAWAALSSAVVLQILSFGTGALVVAGSGFSSLGSRSGFGTGALVALALLSAALTVALLSPPMVRRVVRGVAPGADLTHIPGLSVLAGGAGANIAAWIGYGLAFWLFARGTVPGIALGLGESIGAYTASYVAGVLAPFAPGGLGVREGVLVMALQNRVGLAPALALAAVARIATTAAEVVATIPFLLGTREKPRG